MTGKRPLLGSLLVVVVLIGGWSQRVAAAPAAVSVTTSPITLNLNIPPGTSTTQTLQVMNNTSQAVPMLVSVKTFGADGSSGEASITDFATSDPAASYVHLSPGTFTAQPRTWNYIKATITLPKTATLGYYYAIAFQPLNTPTAKGNIATIKASNAILLLVDTGSANEKKQIQVAGFTASRHIYQYLPAEFNVNLHNSGNIYLAPHGDIFISRSAQGGSTIDTLPVNPGGGNLLPDSNRIFQASWTDGFPVYVPKMANGQPVVDKQGNPVTKLQWNAGNVGKFRFGRYYAHLALAYNNGKSEQVLNATVAFWVIPWEILLVLLIIVLLVLFGFYTIGRSIYRRLRRRR